MPFPSRLPGPIDLRIMILDAEVFHGRVDAALIVTSLLAVQSALHRRGQFIQFAGQTRL
jgi:hypothetical protein